MDLNKWNQGKVSKYLNMWVMLFRGHSLLKIKRGWAKFFHKIRKWLIATIKDKRITSSNTSLKLWIEKKYALDIIPTKNYKKRFVFFVTVTIKDITHH